MAVIAHPEYAPTGWQGTLVFWGILLAATLVNTAFSGVLPYVEILILIFHILGFVAVFIPLVYLAPHNSSKDVW